MKRSISVASAPAKVILFGEHFVVHGTPALLAAINRRTTATAWISNEDKVVIKSDIGASAEFSDSAFKNLDGGKETKAVLAPIHESIKRAMHGHGTSKGIQLELKSKIPYGIGLGSSAASCVATIAAVDSLFGSRHKNWICKNAIESERIIHQNSSGADCYVSTFGGIIRYCKDGVYEKTLSKKQLWLVVSSTGIRHSTGALVERVRKFKEQNLSVFNDLSKQASNICTKALQSIRTGDVENLGRLMTMNHHLLKQIGVSHEKAEALVDLCLKAGALGAKITGAGGGGAVIALASSKSKGSSLAAKMRASGYDSFLVDIDHEGLVVRK
jgi:mevalonate kinase